MHWGCGVSFGLKEREIVDLDSVHFDIPTMFEGQLDW
jgi:hypothetical protein